MNICRRLALVALVVLFILTACIAEASQVDDLLRALETARTPSDRESASTELYYMGEQAVRPLIQVLKRSTNERFRGDAAYTLANMYEALLLPVVDDLLMATNDPHWRVRANIVWALARLESAGDRVAPTLIRLLGDSDSRVRSAAAAALGALGASAEAAVPKLIERLGDSDRDTRYAAVRAIGSIKPQTTEAVNAVIRLLDDKSMWVRAEAATALGNMGVASAEVVQALRTAFYTERDRVKSYYMDEEIDPLYRFAIEHDACLWAIVGALGELGEPAAAVLAEVARDPEDYGRSAIYDLGDIGKPAVPYLVDLVRSLDGEARQLAATELASMYPPPVSELVGLSEDPKPGVRAEAARALGAVRGLAPEVVEVLIELLDDDYEEVRANAVVSLGGMYYENGVPDSVVEGLAKSAADKSDLVRLRSAQSLAFLAQIVPALQGPLFQLARDPNTEVRYKAHEALAGFASPDRVTPEVVELVVEGLSDPDRAVRQISIRNTTVGASHLVYGGETAFDISVVGPKLMALLRDPLLVEEAADALAIYGHDARPALPTLWELHFRPGEGKLGWAIARIGGTAVVGRLREALKSSDRDVRYKAVELASLLGPDAIEAAPELESIRKNDSDFVLRLLAESALAMVQQ